MGGRRGMLVVERGGRGGSGGRGRYVIFFVECQVGLMFDCSKENV